MFMDRRKFVTLASQSPFARGAGLFVAADALGCERRSRCRRFSDHRPAAGLSKSRVGVPAKNAALSEAWRTRLFEYTRLRTLGGSIMPISGR